MKRIKWIDIARGFLISWVVLGHSMPPERLFAFLSYLVYSFVFISGYLYKEKPLKMILLKRFFTLLVPYYFIGTINFLIYFAISKYIPEISFDLKKSLIRFYTVYFTHKNIPQNLVPLWYLPMFFLSEILYSIFKKTRILFLFLSISWIFILFNKVNFPWKINVSFLGLYFLFIGDMFKKFNLYKFKKVFYLFILLVSIAALIYISVINGRVDLNIGNFGKNPLLMFLGSLVFIVFTISFSLLIENRKISFIFSTLGKNTIFVLGYHIDLAIPIYLIFSIFTFPMKLMESFWWLYFLITWISMILFTIFVPNKIKKFLSGLFV